ELTFDIGTDVPACLVGDPARLRQILVNLLSNAIKFPAQGEVGVDVTVESRDSDKVVLHFKVSDTGMGIPKENQHLVFEAFTQAGAATTRQFGGTGLGLSISVHLVGLTQGKMWVESEPG